MKKLLLLLFVSFSLLNAQSVGARFGVFKPHADFRGKTSPGNVAGIFGTLNSPTALFPVEFGASLWLGAHEAEIWEGYWGINFRLYQDRGLSGFVFLRPTMRQIVIRRTLSMESSLNVAAQLGFRLYHFGAILDAGYKFGTLERLNAGGLEISLGYLVEF
jgi:hypothetical protein